MQPQYITLPKRAKDITGERFARLVVLGPIGKAQDGNIIWRCQCDCGNTKDVPTHNLRRKNTRSCGCLPKEAQHGLRDSPLYTTWKSMISRCTNENTPSFTNYGSRGITVCDEWIQSFVAFHNHVAQLPDYNTDTYTLDRIDNDGNYEPGNVRWASRTEQRRNTSQLIKLTFNDKTQCATDWANETGINVGTILARIQRGWPIEKVLTTPVRTQYRWRK